MMAVFHHLYVFIEDLPERDWMRIPDFIVFELWSAFLVIPFSIWDMRASSSHVLLACDATPADGGCASAKVSPSVLTALEPYSEIKGARVRLDGHGRNELL